jgi:hypothetical protein
MKKSATCFLLLCLPPSEFRTPVYLCMTRKPIWAGQYATYIQIQRGVDVPRFITYSPMMDLTGPAGLEGYCSDFTLTCVFVQCWPLFLSLMVVFSLEKRLLDATCCYRFKRACTLIFYTTVKIMSGNRKLLGCFFSSDPQ